MKVVTPKVVTPNAYSNASTFKHIVIDMKVVTPKVVTQNVLEFLKAQIQSYTYRNGYSQGNYTKYLMLRI